MNSAEGRLDPLAWDYRAAQLKTLRDTMTAAAFTYAVVAVLFAVLPFLGADAQASASLAAVLLVFLGAIVKTFASFRHDRDVDSNMEVAAQGTLEEFHAALDRMFTAPPVDKHAEESARKLVMGLIGVVTAGAIIAAVLIAGDVPDLIAASICAAVVFLSALGAARCRATRHRIVGQYLELRGQQLGF